jgi:hypothetical protein
VRVSEQLWPFQEGQWSFELYSELLYLPEVPE